MSRQFKAYASAYSPRGHESTLMQDEVQTYACDFNGALNTGETVASATWSSDNACVGLSTLSVAAGIATVKATAAARGCALLTLRATTSTGRKLGQTFVVNVTPVCAEAQTLSWSA